MFNKSQDAATSLSIAERRLHARRNDMSLAYVEIGDSNGGIVLNISEGGLVLTAAEPLPQDSLLLMRFQLPGSKDWIEATGKIIWISESKREAGVRFVDISQDARDRIRDWTPPPPPQIKSRREPAENLVETKPAASSFPSETSARANPEPLAAAAPAEMAVPDSTVTETVAETLDEDDAEPAREAAPLASKPASSPSLADSDARPHVENPIPDRERRRHPRRRDISLAYIDLGGDNGGIILNISESGLVLAAAAPLYGDQLPKMRFQLPESSEWIDASGEIAWLSESKREAGVRFLKMKDEDRERIRIWVASETASRESQRVSNRSREKSGRLLEMPAPRVTKNAAPPQFATRQEELPDYSIPTPASASSREPFSAMASAADATFPESGLPAHAALNRNVNVADRPSQDPPVRNLPSRDLPTQDLPIQVVVQRRSWGNVFAIVAIASAASFVAGWFAAGPATRNQMLHMFDKNTVDATKPSTAVQSTPTSAEKTTTAGPGASAQQQNSKPNSVAVPPARPAAPDASSSSSKLTSAPPAAQQTPEVAANVPSSTLDKPRVGQPPVDRSRADQLRVEQPRPDSEIRRAPANASQSPAANSSAQIPNTVSAPPKPTSSAPVSSNPSANQPSSSQPEVARAAAAPPPTTAPLTQPSTTSNASTTSPATAPAPASTEPPEIFKGTVNVSFSPYPSIRVPAELKSQVSKAGASLQIGRLTSRVDPAYPAEAERQRVEGTVRVHAIIGRDGAVQSVALISGTSLLAQAVTNAVLQWKYQPTSIGGQAVEAEEDVVVAFKIVKQTSRSN
jgi:TonB family protein